MTSYFTTRRVRVLAILCAACLAAVLARVLYLQTARRDELTHRRNIHSLTTISIPSSRGRIVDRDGVVLTYSEPAFSLYAVPREIISLEDVADLLSDAIGYDKGRIVAKLKRNPNFVWLSRRMDGETAERVRRLNLRGLYFQKTERRAYPFGNLGSNLLGVVGIDREGLNGIERTCDMHLTGRSGDIRFWRDARGRLIRSRGKRETPVQNGVDVVLTISRDLQRTAEQIVDSCEARGGCNESQAVVLDASTGEVLALAAYPRFSPERFTDYSPVFLDRNDPVRTIINCMQVKELALNALHTDEGQLIAGTGSPERDGVASSSVITDVPGCMKVRRVFGLGLPSGIELPGETDAIEEHACALGSADLIGSPLQHLRAMAILVNGGRFINVRLVENPATASPSREHQKVLLSGTSAHIRHSLANDQRLQVPGYESGGMFLQDVHVKDQSKRLSGAIGFVRGEVDSRVVGILFLTTASHGDADRQTASGAFVSLAQASMRYVESKPGR